MVRMVNLESRAYRSFLLYTRDFLFHYYKRRFRDNSGELSMAFFDKY